MPTSIDEHAHDELLVRRWEEAAAVHHAAERTTDQAGDGDRGEIEDRRQPAHLVAADRADDDEHGLGHDVGTHRADDPVLERQLQLLRPRRDAGAEHEPDSAARLNSAAVPELSSPSATMRAAIENGMANTSATLPPARSAFQSSVLTAIRPRRTATTDRACPG